MPKLTLEVAASLKPLVTDSVKKELCSTLRRVVESTFKLEPEDVAAAMYYPEFTQNMKPLEITLEARATPERLGLMLRAREDLFTGFLKLGLSKSIGMQNFLKAVREVQITCYMPEGSSESYQIAD